MTRRRDEVHDYRDDPATPGTCAVCHLADPDRRNAVHDPRRAAKRHTALAAAQHAVAHRYDQEA